MFIKFETPVASCLQSSARPLARLLQEQGWDTAAFVGSAGLKKLFGFNNGFNVYDDEMPRPGQRSQFREDPSEKPRSSSIGPSIGSTRDRPTSPSSCGCMSMTRTFPTIRRPNLRGSTKAVPMTARSHIRTSSSDACFEAIGKVSPADKTITAVLSDHGESLGEHGEQTHGVFLYDSTLRVAFMMKGPGIPAGVRVKQQARTIDFLPTLLAVMGGRADEERTRARLWRPPSRERGLARISPMPRRSTRR